MGRSKHGRFGPGSLLALACFTLVLLLTPAQHEDFSPNAVPGHCHACTASPVASLQACAARDVRPLLPAAGAIAPTSERAEGLISALAASGRAPPEKL